MNVLIYCNVQVRSVHTPRAAERYRIKQVARSSETVMIFVLMIRRKMVWWIFSTTCIASFFGVWSHLMEIHLYVNAPYEYRIWATKDWKTVRRTPSLLLVLEHVCARPYRHTVARDWTRTVVTVDLYNLVLRIQYFLHQALFLVSLQITYVMTSMFCLEAVWWDS